MLQQSHGLSEQRSCHDVESEVRRKILAMDGLTVRSLVVRRIPDGVCIQGVVCSAGSQTSLRKVIAALPGIRQILDRTTICESAAGIDAELTNA